MKKEKENKTIEKESEGEKWNDYSSETNLLFPTALIVSNGLFKSRRPSS